MLIKNIPPLKLAPKQPTLSHFHGQELHDDYAWLRAENWQEAIRNPRTLPPPIRTYLEAENEAFKQAFMPLKTLNAKLKKEMKARIIQEDESLPIKDGGYFYFTRYEKGQEHSQFFRKNSQDKIQLLLDGNALAKNKSYFDLGEVSHAPNHALLSWSQDTSGNELYDLFFKNLDDGSLLKDRLKETDGEIMWGQDSNHFYYLKMDKHHRASKVFRHILGQKQTQDILIYEEKDPRFFLSLSRSMQGDYGYISASASEISEIYSLDLRDNLAHPALIIPRSRGAEFEADYHPRLGTLFLTNEKAEDYELKSESQVFFPHLAGRLIEGFLLLENWLIILCYEAALPQIYCLNLTNLELKQLPFEANAYTLSLMSGAEFAADSFRFSYSSPSHPEEIYEVDLKTLHKTLLKKQIIPSGHVADEYCVERISMTARDGEEIPVTLFYQKDLQYPAPLFLEAYGAYGYRFDAEFESERLSLINRGIIYAICHARGGMDKGYAWYKNGKMAHKENTFYDVIDTVETLIENGITQKGAIVFHGGSAGGMLAGVLANLAPHQFAGIIARVPFVDVLNTMLDETLPLTPPEWEEWGDPRQDLSTFNCLKAYSPYDNIEAKAYPPLFVLGGLCDPRVTYWEPAKYVAKLRTHKSDNNPLLFHTQMSAGHAGSPGRFASLDETALLYAFALDCLDKGE